VCNSVRIYRTDICGRELDSGLSQSEWGCGEERYVQSGSVLSNECHREMGHGSFLGYPSSFVIHNIQLIFCQLHKYNEMLCNNYSASAADSFSLNNLRNHHFFFHGATAPSGPGPPHYRGFTITLRHTTLGSTPLDEWSARHRDLYLTKQYSQDTSIHAPAGIRTQIPASERS
jgi:hypothetical protein